MKIKVLTTLLIVSIILNMFTISFTYDMLTFAEISVADPTVFSRMTIWLLDWFY